MYQNENIIFIWRKQQERFVLCIVLISFLRMLLTNSFAGTEGPEDAEACSKWTRPPPPDLNTAKDNVVFQQIDVDHYIGNV